jgi:hypothetical protein
MAEPMRALTVKQPWAWAITHGTKDVENRSWQPPCWIDHLAIHAGARSGWDRDGEFSPVLRNAWNGWVRKRTDAAELIGGPTRNSHLVPFGAVIAVSTLAGCHLSPDFGGTCGATRPLCSPWAARDQYHWLLTDIRPLAEPVPCRGMLGFWRLPDDVEKLVRAQLEER